MKKRSAVHRPFFALAATLLAVIFPLAPAPAETWDGGGTTDSWGDIDNWSGGTVPTPDAYLTFGSAANYTVDLAMDRDASGLYFNGSAGNYHFTSGNSSVLEFNSINNSSAGTITFDLDLRMGADANINANGSAALIFNGGIDNNGFDLRVEGNHTKDFNGVISGSGGLRGYGYLYSNFTNANTFTGDVITGRGTMALSGNNGAFLNTSAIYITDETIGDRGGPFIVGDNTATSANPNRINDAAVIVLRHGEMRIVGSDNATTTSELVGGLHMAGGSSILSFDPASNREVELLASTLTREAGATLWLEGDKVGQTGANSSRLFLGTSPPERGTGGVAGTTNQSILPSILHFANGEGSLTTVDVTGVRPLDLPTEYASSLSAAFTDENVRLTSNATLAANNAINALVLGSAATGLTLNSGVTLDITAGVLVVSAPSNVTGGTLNFGEVEGLIALGSESSDTTINSAIAGSGGLTIASYSTYGSEGLVLGGNSSYTGTTYLTARTTVTAANALGAAGEEVVVDFGGALALQNGITLQKDVRVIAAGNNTSSEWRRVLHVETGANVLDGDLTFDMDGYPSPLGYNNSTPIVSVDSGASLKLLGDVHQTTNSNLFVSVSPSSRLEFAGGFTGDGTSLATFGSGDVFLTANSTLLLGVSAYGSTVYFNADIESSVNGNFTASSAATFAGTGQINPHEGYDVRINSNAILSPGDPAQNGGIGILTIGDTGSENDLSFASGAKLTMQLGTASDLANVYGGLSLSGSGILVDIFNSGGLAAGIYTLIDYTGSLSGSFSNLTLNLMPTGWNGTLIDNQGNKSVDLLVSAVPEPGTCLLVGLGFTTLLARRRRR